MRCNSLTVLAGQSTQGHGDDRVEMERGRSPEAAPGTYRILACVEIDAAQSSLRTCPANARTNRPPTGRRRGSPACPACCAASRRRPAVPTQAATGKLLRYPVAVSVLVPRRLESDVHNCPHRASQEQQNQQPAPVSKPGSFFRLFCRREGQLFEISVHLAYPEQIQSLRLSVTET
jgi:hypothetical protein